MESSRRVNRVSGRQLEILWEFLISNRSIATAHNRSLQAKEYSKRKWQEIAEILNSQGEGVHKDWSGWSKYWVDYKAKLKKRVAILRTSHVQTGGGPSTERPLSEIEEKFLQILGKDIGQGLPGVQVEIPPEIGGATIELSERKAQNFTTARDAVTEENIKGFREVECYLEENCLKEASEDPARIFNTDESAFYLSPKAGKFLAKKVTNISTNPQVTKKII